MRTVSLDNVDLKPLDERTTKSNKMKNVVEIGPVFGFFFTNKWVNFLMYLTWLWATG